MPVSQILVESPQDSPVLVLLRPPTRFESARSGEGVLSLVDARTGALLYDTGETTPPDRIGVRLDRESRQVTVTTDKCVLTISPTTGAPSAPALHEIRGKARTAARAPSHPEALTRGTTFSRPDLTPNSKISQLTLPLGEAVGFESLTH